MKRITFSCPDELAKQLDNVAKETTVTAPSGLPVKLSLTRTDYIVNALWMYFEKLSENKKNN